MPAITPFSHSPNLQSVQGRTPARGNREFPPARRGVRGGIPIRLPIRRHAVLRYGARSRIALSLAPCAPCLTTNILRSPTSRVHAQEILCIPATGYSAQAAVTQSVTIIYLCLLKESDILRFTLSPQPVIARLVPGNPVKNSVALAAILNGGVSRRRCPNTTQRNKPWRQKDKRKQNNLHRLQTTPLRNKQSNRAGDTFHR